MGFRVHHPSGYESFDGDATYNFNEAGLLVIHLGNQGGRLTYSPNAWTVVEEPSDEGQYLKSEPFRHAR
jgi:hypothetical protein